MMFPFRCCGISLQQGAGVTKQTETYQASYLLCDEHCVFCDSGTRKKMLAVNLMVQGEGMGLNCVDCVLVPSLKMSTLTIGNKDAPHTCFDRHRSSRVLDCVVFKLILLFFLRGLSLSPSSGKNRGVLIDVLGPRSSSESGRKSG